MFKLKNASEIHRTLLHQMHVRRAWRLRNLPLETMNPVPSDLLIAKSQVPKDIKVLAEEIGLRDDELSLFGNKKAKVSLDVLRRLQSQPNGFYVVVTGVTPTQFGEGKTCVLLGLAQALNAQMNLNAFACIRQPSLGPTFGIKGGAAGGGYAQVIPMEDFNLHLTGDMHAITAANNLLAAQLDTRILHENTVKDEVLFNRLVATPQGSRRFSEIQLRRLQRLGLQHHTEPDSLTPEEKVRFARLDIDPDTIMWERAVDINDRYLRQIRIGESTTERGFTRKASFAITAASEVMAILALSTDLRDMKERLAKIVVAFDRRGNPVTADDLGVTGALTVLLRDAIEPNLMQTLEGSPVFVHAGPFANIAHGCSSIVADRIALKLVGGGDGYVCTEAGFGSDIGLEKFCNIKCRISGLTPDAVVLVTTTRAMKMHGAMDAKQFSTNADEMNLDLLQRGTANLLKHISNVSKFGLPAIVAINVRSTDSELELEYLREASLQAGAFAAVKSTQWMNGSAGAVDLAEAVTQACHSPKLFRFLYDTEMHLLEKMQIIARQMYGAGGIQLTGKAQRSMEALLSEGFGNLPICMAKTAASFTDDPAIKGAPEGFTLTVRDMQVSAGAGFVVALCGEITKMPGLPVRPSFYDINFNTETNEIEGLS